MTNAFMLELCFLTLLQNALLPACRRCSPQETHVLFVCTSWEKSIRSLCTLSSTFILGCIPVLSWLHLISAGWHRSPPALLSDGLTTCTDCWDFGCVPCKHRTIAYYAEKKGMFFPMVILPVCLWRKGVRKPAARKLKCVEGKEGNESETMW